MTNYVYFPYLLQSALLLTEVLKEREAQIELKKLREQALGGNDTEFDELYRRNYEEWVIRDQEEAQKRRDEAKKTQHFQKAQYARCLP